MTILKNFSNNKMSITVTLIEAQKEEIIEEREENIQNEKVKNRLEEREEREERAEANSDEARFRWRFTRFRSRSVHSLRSFTMDIYRHINDISRYKYSQ